MTTHSLNADDVKWNRVKELGYSHAELHEIVMDLVLDNEFEAEAADVQIKLYKDMISRQQDKVIASCARLEAEKSELYYLEQKVKYLEQMCIEDKQMIELSQNMARLNKIIVRSDYDLVAIKIGAKPLISAITALNPSFDLAKHVVALKNVL